MSERKPYAASEDSALFRSVLKGYRGDGCLEIGAGNGGNLIELAKGFELVVGTDIQQPGTSDWRKSDVEYLLADAAACFGASTFDLVAFNPPYLRGRVADATVDGGLELEVPMRFLREALRTVKRTGKVLFLLSGEARVGEFEEVCERTGFFVKRVGSRHLFYEDLTVYEASAAGGDAPKPA